MLSWQLFSTQPKGNEFAANGMSPDYFRTLVMMTMMMMMMMIIIIIITIIIKYTA